LGSQKDKASETKRKIDRSKKCLFIRARKYPSNSYALDLNSYKLSLDGKKKGAFGPLFFMASVPKRSD
jgi:hypothetical protein